MKDSKSSKTIPEFKTPEIKQETLVNILVRIEVIELELEKVKKTGSRSERQSRGQGRRNSLKEFDETQV